MSGWEEMGGYDCNLKRRTLNYSEYEPNNIFFLVFIGFTYNAHAFSIVDFRGMPFFI